MREIKFRAWDKKLKEMTDVVCLNLRENSNDHILSSNSHPDCYSQLKENLELMQFIGLKDKNGKEIYEGDVIKLDDEILLVEFCEEYARFGAVIYFQNGLEPENSVWRWGDDLWDGWIVGNQFESPELLETI